MLFKISTACSILLVVVLTHGHPVRLRETNSDLQARDNLALAASSLTARELEDSDINFLVARSNPLAGSCSTPGIAPVEPSTESTNAGHAKIAGGTVPVYYMYKAPLGADLKHELQVLQSFLAAWNANTPENLALDPGGRRRIPQRPSDTKAFPGHATRLIVMKSNHKSPTYTAQALHLTVQVLTDANWVLAGNPLACSTGAVVHVFPINQDPARGYRGYWMYSKNKNRLTSLVLQASLALAEAHNFGTLGQGNLA